MEDVDIKLPKLRGANIEEHFLNIAKDQVEPYQKLIVTILNSKLPEMPKVRNKFIRYILNIKSRFR